MRSPPPPLRFLTLVLGGWLCLRGTVVASGWWLERPEPFARAPSSAPALAEEDAAPVLAPPLPALAVAAPPSASVSITEKVAPAASPARAPAMMIAVSASLPVPAPLLQPEARAPLTMATPALATLVKFERRWSASTWMFVREGGSGSLAPGGTLGGSQTGGRIAYRLNRDQARPLALSGRAYAPLSNLRAAEAAAGVDWKPLAPLPLHLLAERRQALGRDGRSAFSLTAYGGLAERAVGPLRLDAYAQAGVVGLRSRDLFADGSARLSVPAGGARLGAGLWGAAQPGVERLDAGPQVSFRVPAKGGGLTIAADWRLRVAGEAAPASGPTLTVSAGF